MHYDYNLTITTVDENGEIGYIQSVHQNIAYAMREIKIVNSKLKKSDKLLAIKYTIDVEGRLF